MYIKDNMEAVINIFTIIINIKHQYSYLDIGVRLNKKCLK